MLHHSGIGTYLRMLLPYVLAEFSVTLLGDPEVLKAYSGEAAIIPFNAPIYSIEEQKQYKSIVPHTDLFWSPHYNTPVFAVKAKKRVVTIHDVFHLAFFKQLSIKQKIYAKLMISRAVKASDAIITVSNFSKGEITTLAHAKPGKITVIYNGVKQKPLTGVFETVAAKYKLPAKYMLYVGNVKPHKNLKGLVAAYLKLSTEIQQQYKIVVVGKIEGFITGDESLFELINKNNIKDHIVFTGFVNDDDMDTIYAGASLFILPSLYEGFGLPPLEAMVNKCPVLVSNLNSLPEVCGDAAVYFDPQDYDDIALQINKVLSDPSLSKGLVMKGTERIKLFTWADSARQHIQLFKKLINS
ncbi:glycosyltransferase family 1 protein [Mucilaginibacter phyllosphaerae]|nr:glycosyltransferase family 1 protein [Mucilaginibacter phyllosphaerae]GGH18059.1 glycosyl transferase [Mucilaginibacter phyllosphaerae]